MSDEHPLVDPGRPLRWVLPLLLALSGGLVLDELINAVTFKAVTLGLLGAVLFFPTAALFARDAAAAWFPSPPGRLLVLAVGLSALAARHGADAGGLRDALLVFGLANLAALFGLRAAEHAPASLEVALHVLGGLVGAICLAQAAGFGLGLSPDAGEVVGLSGNSTRAGVLLAMTFASGVAALGGSLSRSRAEDVDQSRSPAHPLRSWSSAWPRLALLLLVATAMLLTRARGARLAALVALALVGALSWWRARQPARTEPAGAAPAAVGRGRLLGALAGVLLGALVLTHLIGGPDAVMARKLPADGAILQGTDLTTNVRLALWAGATDMIADAPLGHGLGNFARAFPPYRDALEASLSGLEGAATYARHPHNELLAWGTEGGLAAGLLILLLLLLTLRRGALRCLDENSRVQRVALAVFLTGGVAAMLQDALRDPATALPFWAAVGTIWAPRPREARAWWLGRTSTGLLLLLLGLALGVLAWPRLDAELSLRSALLRYEQTLSNAQARLGQFSDAPGVALVDDPTLALVDRAVTATPRDTEILSFALLFALRARDEAVASGDVQAMVEVVLLVEKVQNALAAAQAAPAPAGGDVEPGGDSLAD